MTEADRQREVNRRDRERDIYLRRYEIEQAADERRFDTSRQFSANYAALALRTLSVLNGGAVVAVPALAQIFQITDGRVSELAISVAMFVCGLITVATAMLLGYLAMEFDATALREMMERKRKQLHLDYLVNIGDPISDREQREGEIDGHESARRRADRKCRRLQITALCAAIASLALFIIGALSAGSLFGVRI